MMKRIRRGVKTRWLLIIALCLLCWTSTGVTNYNAVKSEDKIMYAIFKDKFTEPMEVMYFLIDDMSLYKITSNDENRVSFRIWELKTWFKQHGHKISNVMVIIHNHTKETRFSKNDIIVYGLFKSEGFEGKFYIYVWRTKSIYELAERLR